jgi:integrase
MTAVPSLTKATLQHVKHFLSGVFRHANVIGIHEGNPVTLAHIPKCSLPAGKTGVYTLSDLSAVLLVLDPLPRAVVAMAGFAGLRRAELQGLLWSDYSGDAITVNQTAWREHINPPKSVASANFVPVIPQLRATIDEYQRSLGNAAAGPMFPVDLDHMGRRTVKTAMKKVGLAWRGWHAFRRGLASNLFALGADDITVQRVLRHAKVQVTRDHYIKIRDPKLEAAMERLSAAVGVEKG